MSPENAQLVVVGLTLVGAVVWLISLTLLVHTSRQVPLAKRDDFSDGQAREVLTGCAEVEGDAQALATLAAAFLAKGAWGPVKIVEKTDDRVVFDRSGPFADQPAGRWFRRGELRFTSLRQNRTEVVWNVEPGNFRWMLWAAGLVQLLGLLALIIGCVING